MGNIFSKKVSLTDLLFTIEEKINKVELSILQTKKNKNKKHSTYNIFGITAYSIFVSYTYYTDQNVVFAFLLGLLCFFIFKYAISLYYKIVLNRKERYLTALKETQRKNIEELKKQRKYFETKSIVDKYEKKDKIGVIKVDEHKTLIDRVADIVLGDDPAKMYALICDQCHAHNGLSHPDEYDLAKYKCKECGFLNDKSLKLHNNPSLHSSLNK